MPPMMLTAVAVQKLRPNPAKRLEIPDTGCSGLSLCIHPSGRKVFITRFRRPDGRPAKMTLGRSDSLTLAEARRIVADINDKRSSGRDPIAEKMEKKNPELRIQRYVRHRGMSRDELEELIEESERLRSMKGLLITYIFIDRITARVKIGRSNNVLARLRGLMTGAGADLYLIAAIPGNCERALHKRFGHARLLGEWFDGCDEHLSQYLLNLCGPKSKWRVEEDIKHRKAEMLEAAE